MYSIYSYMYCSGLQCLPRRLYPFPIILFTVGAIILWSWYEQDVPSTLHLCCTISEIPQLWTVQLTSYSSLSTNGGVGKSMLLVQLNWLTFARKKKGITQLKGDFHLFSEHPCYLYVYIDEWLLYKSQQNKVS